MITKVNGSDINIIKYNNKDIPITVFKHQDSGLISNDIIAIADNDSNAWFTDKLDTDYLNSLEKFQDSKILGSEVTFIKSLNVKSRIDKNDTSNTQNISLWMHCDNIKHPKTGTIQEASIKLNVDFTQDDATLGYNEDGVYASILVNYEFANSTLIQWEHKIDQNSPKYCFDINQLIEIRFENHIPSLIIKLDTAQGTVVNGPTYNQYSHEYNVGEFVFTDKPNMSVSFYNNKDFTSMNSSCDIDIKYRALSV